MDKAVTDFPDPLSPTTAKVSFSERLKFKLLTALKVEDSFANSTLRLLTFKIGSPKLFMNLFLLFVSAVFSSNSFLFVETSDQFVSPEEAYTITINSFDDHVLIDLKLHQNVYVYSDKLNFTISPENKNLKVETESLIIKDEFFGESEVFINNIFFNVPNLKDGILSFKLNYLGCYQGKYCYPEKNNKIDLLFKENRLISKKIL